MGNCCDASYRDSGEASVGNILEYPHENGKSVSAMIALEEFNNQQAITSSAEEIKDTFQGERVESYDPQASQSQSEQLQQLIFRTQSSMKPSTPYNNGRMELRQELDKIISDTQCDTERNPQEIDLQIQKRISSSLNESELEIDCSFQNLNQHNYPKGYTIGMEEFQISEEHIHRDISSPLGPKKTSNFRPAGIQPNNPKQQ